MLFFKRKKEPTLGNDLIEFLNLADMEYMRAFSIRSVKALSTYMSRECVLKLSVQVYNGQLHYFGSDKFRSTKWEVISKNNGIYDVRKSVSFDEIKFTRSLKMSVATDYKELWRVNTNGDLCVLDISKLA